jgi:hypothetical protein
MLRLAQNSFNVPAMSKACWRLSIWQGPAMSVRGAELENVAAPALTIGFGFVMAFALKPGSQSRNLLAARNVCA